MPVTDGVIPEWCLLLPVAVLAPEDELDLELC